MKNDNKQNMTQIDIPKISADLQYFTTNEDQK